MTTENTDKAQTPAEADSQGHCALGDGSTFRLRTKSLPRFYVHELRGVCYVSFVPAHDRAYAANFDARKSPVADWLKVVQSIAGCELEAVATQEPMESIISRVGEVERLIHLYHPDMGAIAQSLSNTEISQRRATDSR